MLKSVQSCLVDFVVEFCSRCSLNCLNGLGLTLIAFTFQFLFTFIYYVTFILPVKLDFIEKIVVGL